MFAAASAVRRNIAAGRNTESLGGRFARNTPTNFVDPTGLMTVKPTSYLPALSGNPTGFGRGTSSPTALDLAYSNLNLSGPLTPTFQTNVDPGVHRQAILDMPWYSSSFGPMNFGAATATPRPSAQPTAGRVSSAPSPPSSGLFRDLTSAGNSIRGAANYVASGIEEYTATGHNGVFGTGLAVWGGVQAHSTRLVGNVFGGIVDVPGTVGSVRDDFNATGQVYQQYGLGAAAARQVGLLQWTEALYGTDVLTGEAVDPWAKTSEGFARFGGTAGTAAGIGAGWTRLIVPDGPDAPGSFRSTPHQGNQAHANFRQALIDQTGTRTEDWFMRTEPGMRGVDAEYVGPQSLYPGFRYAELKPFSQSPTALPRYQSQLDRWELPQGETQLWLYNQQNVIGSSGTNW